MHSNCSICLKGRICKELEVELSKMYAHTSVHAHSISYIDSLREEEKLETLEAKALELLDKLRAHALPDIYIQVLILKFAYDYDHVRIAKELSLPYWQTSKDIYYSAIELLKEIGYK